jgi:hypothetical protein
VPPHFNAAFVRGRQRSEKRVCYTHPSMKNEQPNTFAGIHQAAAGLCFAHLQKTAAAMRRITLQCLRAKDRRRLDWEFVRLAHLASAICPSQLLVTTYSTLDEARLAKVLCDAAGTFVQSAFA